MAVPVRGQAPGPPHDGAKNKHREDRFSAAYEPAPRISPRSANAGLDVQGFRRHAGGLYAITPAVQAFIAFGVKTPRVFVQFGSGHCPAKADQYRR